MSITPELNIARGPTIILALIAALLGSESVLAQQTIESRGGANLVYTCPTGQTIDTAYYPTCSAQDQSSPALSLSGISVYVRYATAPSNYQTTSGDLHVLCGYGVQDGNAANYCSYRGGGGTPLTADGKTTCPPPPSTVPQLSGGGNYRRRSPVALQGRVVISQRPAFVCPHTSSNPLRYLSASQLYEGTLIWSDSGTRIMITCELADGTVCDYVQDSSGAVSFKPGRFFQEDECPSTLCDAIYNGSGNMRRAVGSDAGASVEDKLASRQVDMQSLRQKLAAQR